MRKNICYLRLCKGELPVCAGIRDPTHVVVGGGRCTAVHTVCSGLVYGDMVGRAWSMFGYMSAAEPVCCMLKAMATMGSGCGSGRSASVCLKVRRGTVLSGQCVGAKKGPAIRPCSTSLAISVAMKVQRSSTLCCLSLC